MLRGRGCLVHLVFSSKPPLPELVVVEVEVVVPSEDCFLEGVGPAVGMYAIRGSGPCSGDVCN